MINNLELDHRIREVISDVVDNELYLRTDRRRTPKSRIETWAMVPVLKWDEIPGKGILHFLDRDAEWIAQAGQESGHSHCIAVAFGDAGVPTSAHSVPMTSEGLVEFSLQCAGVPYLLTTEEGAFAILCTTSNYNIVAGPYRFVCKSIGASIDAVRDEFRITAKCEDGELGELLQSVSARYEAINGQVVEPIHAPEKIASLRSLIDDIVEEEIHISKRWIEANNWAVAPIESGLYLSQLADEWLSEAAQMMQCNQLWAISTESETAEHHRVPAHRAGITSFRRECSVYHYVLVPENRSFIVLYTKEDYVLIAGPANFVTKALGASIAASRRQFMERYADDLMWPPKVREFLISVAKRYEPYNGE